MIFEPLDDQDRTTAEIMAWICQTSDLGGAISDGKWDV